MDGLISLHEAAKISGYHQDYLSYLIRNKKLPGVRIGRSWGLKRQDLINFISAKQGNTIKNDGGVLRSIINNTPKSILIYLSIFILLILVYVVNHFIQNSANITENNSKNVGQFQTNILYSEEKEFSSSMTVTNSLK